MQREDWNSVLQYLWYLPITDVRPPFSSENDGSLFRVVGLRVKFTIRFFVHKLVSPSIQSYLFAIDLLQSSRQTTRLMCALLRLAWAKFKLTGCNLFSLTKVLFWLLKQNAFQPCWSANRSVIWLILVKSLRPPFCFSQNNYLSKQNDTTLDKIKSLMKENHSSLS